ncbi:hypothetical protein NLU13_3841 [Sarocladium strictum]|uniref:Uncharacterized protein n=1 Tax=Sarocladium strictum TaxID=5046 RepID=A0AA39GHS6_SARSR|nr:hypothetical protein NLU13_3841 [Sarocladium strictum]
MTVSNSLLVLAMVNLVPRSAALNFTIHNGQIFTPGFAVLNSPQPETPMGGDDLHISLDVTANGKLPLKDFGPDDPSQIFNITVFLYSYETERNFTITNGTASANNASLGNIMRQEPGSTVKHINWDWPDCLVGDGQPDSDDSARGTYNISIRQNFRLNGEDHYTIFDVPISVTNRIDQRADRPSCDSLNNELLSPEQIDMASADEVGVLFAPGEAQEVDVGNPRDKNNGGGGGNPNKGGNQDGDQDGDQDGGQDGDEEGLGGDRDRAGPADGLGDATLGTKLSWTALAVGMVLCGVFM